LAIEREDCFSSLEISDFISTELQAHGVLLSTLGECMGAVIRISNEFQNKSQQVPTGNFHLPLCDPSTLKRIDPLPCQFPPAKAALQSALQSAYITITS
jgi:hypothetical protein